MSKKHIVSEHGLRVGCWMQLLLHIIEIALARRFGLGISFRFGNTFGLCSHRFGLCLCFALCRCWFLCGFRCWLPCGCLCWLLCCCLWARTGLSGGARERHTFITGGVWCCFIAQVLLPKESKIHDMAFIFKSKIHDMAFKFQQMVSLLWAIKSKLKVHVIEPICYATYSETMRVIISCWHIFSVGREPCCSPSPLHQTQIYPQLTRGKNIVI